ncbi:MAG: isochorismatase family protein [Acidobacteriia bacterium]|nr:isochorismatase family protein [Terriglobia bacterium]
MSGSGYKEMRSFYEKRGLAGRVGFGSAPAVLVVDFYRGSLDAQSPLGCDLEKPLAETVRILEAARQARAPVLFTVVEYSADLHEGGHFFAKVPSLKILVAGSRWVELDARLGRRAEEPVIKKHFASAFFGTDLAERLRALGVDTVIVTGCTTSGCVRATVVDALQNGFRAIVPEEAVGDRAEAAHAANLFDMDAKYGDVVTVAAVLEYLGRLGKKEGQKIRPGAQ